MHPVISRLGRPGKLPAAEPANVAREKRFFGRPPARARTLSRGSGRSAPRTQEGSHHGGRQL